MSAIPKHLPAIKGATAKRTVSDKFGFWKDKAEPTANDPNERKVRSGGKEYHTKTYFQVNKKEKFKITELEGNGQKYRFYQNINDKNEPINEAKKQVFDGKDWK